MTTIGWQRWQGARYKTAVIGFLHTAAANRATFATLLREMDARVDARHTVDETLLADARAAGTVTPAVARRVAAAVEALVGQGAGVVVCTCSTIGAAAEAASRPAGVTVLRVDRPMAERAVELGRRIVVVAALPSTVGPTTDLLRDVARRAQRAVEITEVVCTDAWPHFERGDTATYLAEVGRALRQAAALGDVVVLAQASMAAAGDAAADLAVPVLSSPRLGVAAAVRALRERGCPTAA
jgi:glutamate racemase